MLNSQKGFTPLVLLIISIIVIVGILIGGYFYFNGKLLIPQPVSITKQPDVASNCEYSDPDLCKFLNQQKIARNYTRKSTNKTTNNDSSPVTFDYVYHYDDKGNQYWLMYRDDDVMDIQLLIEGKHFVKTDGGWIRITDANPEFFYYPFRDKFKDRVAEGEEEGEQQSEPKIIKLKYELVSKEACENLQCFKYKLIDDGGLFDKTRNSSIEFVWFDDKDYLLRKNQLDDKPASTIEYYSYEKIEFPSPAPVVKEMTGQEVFQ